MGCPSSKIDPRSSEGALIGYQRRNHADDTPAGASSFPARNVDRCADRGRWAYGIGLRDRGAEGWSSGCHLEQGMPGELPLPLSCEHDFLHDCGVAGESHVRRIMEEGVHQASLVQGDNLKTNLLHLD